MILHPTLDSMPDWLDLNPMPLAQSLGLDYLPDRMPDRMDLPMEKLLTDQLQGIIATVPVIGVSLPKVMVLSMVVRMLTQVIGDQMIVIMVNHQGRMFGSASMIAVMGLRGLGLVM